MATTYYISFFNLCFHFISPLYHKYSREELKTLKEVNLKKQLVLILAFLALVYIVKDKIILSSEDRVAQYVACQSNEGLKEYSHFSNEVTCNDKEVVKWK